MSAVVATFSQIALRHLFRIVNGATPDSQNSAYWGGDVQWVTPEDLSGRSSAGISESKRTVTEAGYRSCGTTVVPPGSIVLSTRAPIGNLAITERDMCTNQGCKSLVPLAGSSVRFFFYQLSVLTRQLNRMGRGTTFLELSSSELAAFKVHVPAPDEQHRIANFLDDKTARIDALIAEKERLLESLVEWRSAELTRICFGESRPQVSTGNPWLPALPRGWRAMRLKHLVRGIEQGWSPECEGRLADEGEWGVLKAGAANAGLYRENENKALPASLEPLPDLEVKPGDVLITRASGTADYVGSFAYVYATRPKLMLSDKNFRLKFGNETKLLPELLAWMCNTRVLREQILQFVSGADGLAKNIGSGSLRELWLAVPPLEAQPKLVSELHASRSKLDGLSQHVVEHVVRLREYRSSLISAAVTGQLDIASCSEVRA